MPVHRSTFLASENNPGNKAVPSPWQVFARRSRHNRLPGLPFISLLQQHMGCAKRRRITVRTLQVVHRVTVDVAVAN